MDVNRLLGTLRGESGGIMLSLLLGGHHKQQKQLLLLEFVVQRKGNALFQYLDERLPWHILMQSFEGLRLLLC